MFDIFCYESEKFTDFVKDVLNELNLKFSANEDKKYDYGFVYSNDKLALDISKSCSNFYSTELVDTLLKKDTLTRYLKKFGFDILPDGVINTKEDLENRKNYIIKPLIGTGGKIITKEYRDDKHFSYKIFEDVYPEDVLKYPGEYLWQEAITEKTFITYTISGSINKNSDVWFFRDSKNEKINTVGYNFRARKYNYPEINYLHTKLEEFIKHHRIKNSIFAVQFFEIGNKHFVHDWNFRISNRYYFDMYRGNRNEMIKFFSHLFDLPCNLPEIYSDEWIIRCLAEKKEFNIDHYYVSDFVIK